jgi:hypothetical protein
MERTKKKNRYNIADKIHDEILTSQQSPNTAVIAEEQSPWEGRTPASEEFVRAYIGSFSREPFQRQLAKFLQCAPDRQSIIAFAKRNPDKWAKTIQVFAALSGYAEKMEVDLNINIQNMSDTQIEARLLELDTLLIEHQPSTERILPESTSNEHQEDHE